MQAGSRCSSTPSCFQASPLNLVQLRFCHFNPLYFPSFVFHWCMIRLCTSCTTKVNGFSVKDNKLTRRKMKGDGEEILSSVSVRCAFSLVFDAHKLRKQTLPLCIFLQCKLHLSWTQGRSSPVLGLAGRCGEWMWKKYSASCSQWQWLRFSCPHGTPSFCVVVMVFCCGW